MKNNQLAHEWFYQTKNTGSGSSYFYEGPIIYSYGRHFPIARIVENNGTKTILFTNASYSQSTSTHASYTRRAIPPDVPIIEMKEVPTGALDKVDHTKNFEGFKNDLKAALKGLESARKKEVWIAKIESIVAQFKSYTGFFDIAIPEEMAQLFNEPTTEKFDAYLVAEAHRIAADKAKALLQISKQVKKMVSEWQAGKRSQVSLHGWKFAYLRINKQKNRIETTEGIEVPTQKAKHLYQRIQKTLSKGGCKGECGDDFMERYRVVEISKKVLHIGCHIIEMKEVNRIAKSMGWQVN